MTTQELIKLLEDFIHLPGENEVVEFKKAQNGFDTQKLGEYFSALSNEANLGQEEFAWLLFGIHDKTHAILGSSYKPTRPSLDALKREIAEGTNCGITFTEIHEIMYQGKRVIMFQIPAAPKGIPTSYKEDCRWWTRQEAALERCSASKGNGCFHYPTILLKMTGCKSPLSERF